MKIKLTKKRICLFVIIVLVISSFVYFKAQPLLDIKDEPEIRFINVDYNTTGKSQDITIHREDMTDEMNKDILSVLYNAKIRNKILPSFNSYPHYEGYIYFTIVIEKKVGTTFVQLCNDTQYATVYFNGKDHHHLDDAKGVYEAIYPIIYDYLSSKDIQLK